MGILDKFKAQNPAVTTTTTVDAPVSTVVQQQPVLRLRENKSFPWRRFAISIMGIFIILFVWRWSVNHLYTLPDKSIGVFGSITNNAMYAITFLVAYFVTGQAYFTNWSNVSASSVVTEVKSYLESKKEEKKPKAKKNGS